MPKISEVLKDRLCDLVDSYEDRLAEADRKNFQFETDNANLREDAKILKAALVSIRTTTSGRTDPSTPLGKCNYEATRALQQYSDNQQEATR